MRLSRRLIAVLLAGLTSTAGAQGNGWIVDFTWRYEAQSARTLKGGNTGPGGADTRISGASDIRIAAEARGRLEFAEELWPGRYKREVRESWRFKGNRPAFAAVEIASQFDEAARINAADGEGANTINAERKGLVGRTRHERRRAEVKASGDDAGWIGDHADLTIDRVANKLRIENRIDLQINRKTVRPTLSAVRQMDKPAAAGQWDSAVSDEAAWRVLPAFAPRNEIVFDIPSGVEQFTLSRTFDLNDIPDPHESSGVVLHPDFRSPQAVSVKSTRRGTLTLNVRRATSTAGSSAAAAASPAPAVAPPAATATTIAPTPATTAPVAAAPAASKADASKSLQPPTTQEALDAAKKLKGLFAR